MDTEKLKCAIVDDCELHRTSLKKLIDKHPDLSCEASYRNGIAAKNAGVEKNVDLIFLDVEMPFIDGFDLMESFKEKPQIIVVSGKSDHALRAFDYNVTDYLLKPFSKSRFDMAIQKVLKNISAEENSDENEHLFVRSNFRKVKVNYKEIKWIEALGDYVKLVTEKKNVLVLTSMKAFQERLPKEKFLRIHKSYIINMDRLENFNNSTVQVCGKQMPLSRKRRSEFMSALGVGQHSDTAISS